MYNAIKLTFKAIMTEIFNKKFIYFSKYIIVACLLSSANCFADWRNWDEVLKDITGNSMETENKLKNNTLCEFGVLNLNKTVGLHLKAIDLGFMQEVYLRVNLNSDINRQKKIDYQIHLGIPLSNKTCNLFLDLLDSDKFLIESIYISKLAENYTGNLNGQFILTEAKINKIKYFDVRITS